MAKRIVATDVSEASGILAYGKTRSHGHAFGDYDRDGDLDIWVSNGGPQGYEWTAQRNFLWENQGNGNAWLMLDLEGVYDWLDESVRVVVTEVLHEVKRRMN